MKATIYLLVSLFFIGCGEGENSHVLNTQNGIADYAMHADALGNSCNEQMNSHLRKKEVDRFAGLKLFFDSGTIANTKKLLPNASIKDKCDEISDHFSASSFPEDGANIPGGLVFDIDLPFEEGSKALLLSGKKATARVADVFFSYVDGSLDDTKWQIKLRCPKPFSVSCNLERNEENGETTCTKYFVEFEDQICSFGNTNLPFHFSDQAFITLDLEGELKFSGSNAELMITKASWIGT